MDGRAVQDPFKGTPLRARGAVKACTDRIGKLRRLLLVLGTHDRA